MDENIEKIVSRYSRDSLISRIADHAEQTRDALDRFVETEDENSDEANEGNIEAARLALDALDGCIEDLVP